MMRRRTTIFPLLFILGISGCAWIRQNRVVNSPGLGRIDNNIYTSPRQSFRLRLPWLAPDATLRDEQPTADTLLVTIEDDLCREIVVSERPGSLAKESLQSWVDAYIVEELKRLGFEVRSKPLTTRNGAVIELRYRAPAAAPCRQTTNGKTVVAKLDADVGWYVYHRDGVFYRLIYVVAIGPGAPRLWYINRESVDAVLAQFADGFEMLEMNAGKGSTN